MFQSLHCGYTGIPPFFFFLFEWVKSSNFFCRTVILWGWKQPDTGCQEVVGTNRNARKRPYIHTYIYCYYYIKLSKFGHIFLFQYLLLIGRGIIFHVSSDAKISGLSKCNTTVLLSNGEVFSRFWKSNGLDLGHIFVIATRYAYTHINKYVYVYTYIHKCK